MELEGILDRIGNSQDDIVEMMSGMIAIPAISPETGGDGESARADYLIGFLKGFDSVERIDVPDGTDPSVMRSNLLARKNGKRKGTVWIVAHTDTVPVGDISKWDTDPFEAVVKDGSIYGRGTEDNGQSVLSSYIAVRDIVKEPLEGMSIGIAWVADEEVASEYGTAELIRRGCFSEDDVFLVPDWGTPAGKYVDVSEKGLIWLDFEITGNSAHASTPGKAVNALKVGALFMNDLLDVFSERFRGQDDLFDPPNSSFEPTRADPTVSNVNTIPGRWSFSVDCRVLPCYRLDDVLETAEVLAERYTKETGAQISVREMQRHEAGRASSTDSPLYRTLTESVKEMSGVTPMPIGVGGATCANFFRLMGCDAYVWETGGGTLHQPNEHVVIDEIIADAKVFATVLWKLCRHRGLREPAVTPVCV